jgi:uncharacterized coiled-coil protein SlyX
VVDVWADAALVSQQEAVVSEQRRTLDDLEQAVRAIRADLAAHEQTLTELSEKLKTSESSLEQSTLLSEKLSRQNEDLKNCNSQIGERMYHSGTFCQPWALRSKAQGWQNVVNSGTVCEYTERCMIRRLLRTVFSFSDKKP